MENKKPVRRKPVKRKKKKTSNFNVVIILLLIIIITSVVIILFNKKDTTKSSSENPSSLISEDKSFLISENSTEEISDEPVDVEFWGNKIDLSLTKAPDNAPGKYPKWPAELTFEFPAYNLKTFKNQANTDKPLRGAVIFLDPGHGGHDYGVVYPTHPIRPDIIERDLVMKVSLSLKEYLEESGAKVIMTREDGEFYSLYNRSAVVANYILKDFLGKLDADSPNRKIIEGYIGKMDDSIKLNDHTNPKDIFYPKGVYEEVKNILDIQSGYSNCIFLSIHCNSSPTPDTLKGTRVYYATNDAIYRFQANAKKEIEKPEYQNYNDGARTRFAHLLYDNIVLDQPDMKFPNPDQGVLTNDYSVIRKTNLVCALVEMGYANHVDDRKILLDPAHQEMFVKSMHKAIYQYYCE